MNAWCSWKSEDSRAFSSILNVVEEIPSDNSNEIFDLLDEDKCISLNNSDNVDCSVYINTSQNNFVIAEKEVIHPSINLITDILLISEAKTVEAFTNIYQEYYKTFQSILISNCEDTKIYKTLITFSKPQTYVLLKLKGLFCKENLWIYGIYIKVVANTKASSGSVPTDESNIDAILKERNVVLSEKAESFKKLYSLFQVSQSKCPNTIPLDKVFPAICQSYILKDHATQHTGLIDKTENYKSVTKENCNLKDTEINPALPFIDKRYQSNFASLGSGDMLLNIQDMMSKNAISLPPLQKLITTVPDKNLALLHSLVSQHEEDCCLQNSMLQDVHFVHKKDKEVLAMGEQEESSMNDSQSIHNIMESLIDTKLHEFEIKMKSQIEESSQNVLKKLSCIESLLTKIINDKSS